MTVILNTDSLMWDKGRSCAYAFCLQSQFQNGSGFFLFCFSGQKETVVNAKVSQHVTS